MKSFARAFLTVAFASLIAASAALATPEALKIDPNHSLVGFQIRHLFTNVSGRFKDVDGTVYFDPKDIGASSVDVTIQAASINTENERRDSDLRGASFFEVDKHPTLNFRSTKVVPVDGKSALQSGDKFRIEGDLTIHGVTKPVTLDATFVGGGPVAIGGRSMGTVAGFQAGTTIDRKDFGIVWNRTLDQGGTLLGNDVTIQIQIEAKTPPETPTAEKTGDAK